MEIVATSFLAFALVIALAVQGPFRGMWLFMAATAFGAAAAFNMPALGGASILVADIAALTMFALVLLHRGGAAMIAGSARVGQPGFWLMLLIVLSIVVTLICPILFRGATEVFSLSRDLDDEGIVRIPLGPSTGNLTQLFRLLLGGAIFFALATVFRVRPDARVVLTAVAVTTTLNAALGWADVLTHAVGLPELLDTIRSANYAMLDAATMGGLKRMVGGFPEASSYGYFSLGLFAFWLQLWFGAPGHATRPTRIMLALSAVSVLRSTSSAAYVAILALVAVLVLAAAAANLRRQVSRRAVVIAFGLTVSTILGGLGLVLAYQLMPQVQVFFDNVLLQKMEGDSGVERMSWNAQAFRNFLDTFGLGAGLGSVRGSSWLMATLASIGVAGTALYLAFILSVLLGGAGRGGGDERAAVIRALRAGCLGLVLSSLLTGATPDLGLIFFAFMGLAAGLARGAVLAGETGPSRPPSHWRRNGNNVVFPT